MASSLASSMSSIPTPYQSGTELLVNSAFMTSIGGYLVSNTKLVSTFTGAMVAFPFTPIVASDQLNIVGALLPYTIGQGGSEVFLPWIQSIYLNISTLLMVSNGVMTVPTPVPAFSLLSIINMTQIRLKNIYESCIDPNGNLIPGKNPQLETLTELCTMIIDDIKLGFSKTPIPSMYASGVYAGTSLITSVIIT